jgi:hypothetical protein
MALKDFKTFYIYTIQYINLIDKYLHKEKLKSFILTCFKWVILTAFYFLTIYIYMF